MIEVAPLAFMRGRTLNDAFVILDEAQNTTQRADEDVPHPAGLRLEGGGDRRRDADRPAGRQGQRPGRGARPAARRRGHRLHASSASATSCDTRWCSRSSAPTSAAAPGRPRSAAPRPAKRPRATRPADDGAAHGAARAAPLDRALVRRRAARLLRALELPHAELSIQLVGDAEMAALNARYRGRRGPTDVLSFSLVEGHAERRGALLGDVVISLETAARQAARGRRTLDDEVARLRDPRRAAPDRTRSRARRGSPRDARRRAPRLARAAGVSRRRRAAAARGLRRRHLPGVSAAGRRPRARPRIRLRVLAPALLLLALRGLAARAARRRRLRRLLARAHARCSTGSTW